VQPIFVNLKGREEDEMLRKGKLQQGYFNWERDKKKGSLED
jgi:hypothetical protein